MTKNQSDTGVGLTTGTKAGTSSPMAQGENLNSIDTNKAGSKTAQTHGTKSPDDQRVADPAHVQPDEG